MGSVDNVSFRGLMRISSIMSLIKKYPMLVVSLAFYLLVFRKACFDYMQYGLWYLKDIDRGWSYYQLTVVYLMLMIFITLSKLNGKKH